MTAAEITAALESGDYSAEMLMQHLIRHHNRLEQERALADKLRKCAQALVDRWETPVWKDAPHTGKFIRSLGDALVAWEEARP
jgi:chemotaxis regulatin CheY-phosphate phosphatase CheZ